MSIFQDSFNFSIIVPFSNKGFLLIVKFSKDFISFQRLDQVSFGHSTICRMAIVFVLRCTIAGNNYRSTKFFRSADITILLVKTNFDFLIYYFIYY